MQLHDLILQSLQEDIGSGDITTSCIVSPTLKGKGEIRSKQELVVAGVDIAKQVFLCLDSKIDIHIHHKDGSHIDSGTVIMSIHGLYGKMLQAERVALNFLQHLCGIATLTQKYVLETRGTKTIILDTRKTLPLYRTIEKQAVCMGGGENHRMGLFDVVLIKDNHIAAMNGNVEKAITLVRKKNPNSSIIVEIHDPNTIEIAIHCGIKHLLLDNMNNEDIAHCITIVKGRAKIEVSGKMSIERIRSLSEMGVDYISVGALTHSAPAADLSMKMEIA